MDWQEVSVTDYLGYSLVKEIETVSERIAYAAEGH